MNSYEAWLQRLLRARSQALTRLVNENQALKERLAKHEETK